MTEKSKASSEDRRIYRPRFWRDRVWITSILTVLGIPLMILGLTMALLAVGQWTGFPLSSEPQVDPAIVFLLGFLFYLFGDMFFYIFWSLFKSEVVFGQGYLLCSRPSFFLFYRSRTRVPIQSIGSVLLGQVAMSHIVPGSSDTAWGRAARRDIGIEIGYETDGKKRTLSLPIINEQAYFSEISGLIEELKLSATRAPFIFIRMDWDGLPQRSWIERAVPFLEIGFFIISIVALILKMVS